MLEGMSAEQDSNLGVNHCGSDSDGDVPDARHTALLEAVSQLDGKQRVRAPSRSEPSFHVSEFHLIGSGSGGKSKIHVTELAKVLGKRSSHVDIGRKVQLMQKKSKTLPKPLEKNISEKVRRSVGFENVKKELGKWDAVVHKNRSVDTLNFPLNSYDDQPLSSNAFIAKLKSQKPTELEARVAEILSESPCGQEDGQEEEMEYPMSLEELLEHRKEMAKMRALQSYKAAKAARQKRIKSKKYHRLQRREGIKKQIKNFEVLQKTDPEAALKQLEELERVRVEERMTLRHRSTGHWARSKVVQAKYDKEARRVLAEQLAISRELTQKVGQEADSGLESETGDPEVDVPETSTSLQNADNPWMVKSTAEINQFVSGYRKFWNEQNKRIAETEINEKDMNESKQQNEDDSINNSKRIKLIENVVERVELLGSIPDDKSLGHTSVEKAESMHENHTHSLHAKKNSVKYKYSKNVMKTKNYKYIIGDETENEKLNQQEHLLGKRRKQKSDMILGEQNNLTTSAVDAHNVISTCMSWSVTVVPKNQYASECNEKKNKVRSKKSNVSAAKATDQLKRLVDVKIDDLFDEAEEILKQKVRKKVNILQSRLKEGDKAKLVEKQSEGISDEVIASGPSLEMKKSVTRPVVDEELGEVPHHSDVQADTGQINLDELASLSQAGRGIMQQSATPSSVSIDPNNFLQVKQKHLMSQLPDVETKGDEAMDDDDDDGMQEGEDEAEREKLIAEAFADDDVVAEFRDEKEDLIEKSKPKDIDLTLPGWGDWGGPNIEVSKRKKRRFIIKVPKDAPRRDDNKGNLIINEDKNTKIKQHQVNQLPFPFQRVQDFEASIRAPVGRNWVPEMAHRKMIAPSVRTKLGTVIEPMDEDVLFNKKKKGKKKFYPI